MLHSRDPLQIQGHMQTESQGMGKGIPCKWNSKESWCGNTHLDKLDFKIKAITRDKEGHYIMIKRSTQEEVITSENIFATNIEAPQYLR